MLYSLLAILSKKSDNWEKNVTNLVCNSNHASPCFGDLWLLSKGQKYLVHTLHLLSGSMKGVGTSSIWNQVEWFTPVVCVNPVLRRLRQYDYHELKAYIVGTTYIRDCLKNPNKDGVLTFNPSTQEAMANYLWVQGQPCLHLKFQICQGYIVEPCPPKLK